MNGRALFVRRSPTTDPLGEAVTWFTRLHVERNTEAERIAFEIWRSSSGRHAEAYASVVSLWDVPAFETALWDIEPVAMATRRLWPPLAAAAVLILTLGLVFLSDTAMRWGADYSTGVGERMELTTTDGSAVLLGSETAMSVAMSASSRRLHLLSGDVYIQAADDPARRFIVDAGAIQLQVAAATFAVQRSGSGIVITVREGLVQVSGKGGDAFLHSGEQLHINNMNIFGMVNRVEHAQAFDWVSGRLVFQNRPLAEVLEKLDHYHPGWIWVTNQKLARQRISGDYRLDDPVAVAAALADVAGARFTRVSDRLLILR